GGEEYLRLYGGRGAAAIGIVQRAKNPQALGAGSCGFFEPSLVQREARERAQRLSRVVDVAHPSVLNQTVVEHLARDDKIEPLEGALARKEHRERGAEHAARALPKPRALETPALRLGEVGAEHCGEPEQQQGMRLAVRVAGGLRQRETSGGERLDSIGAEPDTIGGQEDRRIGFAGGIAQVARQRHCLAEDFIAALSVVQAESKPPCPE